MRKEITDHSKSIWKLTLEAFLEHKLAVVGAIVIAIFLGTAALAPLISKSLGIFPDTQNVFARYQPPMSYTSLEEDEQEVLINALIDDRSEEVDALLREAHTAGYIEDVSDKTEGIFTLIELLQEERTPASLQSLNQIGLVEDVLGQFRTLHILGTDELGRDVLMRLIYGARVSMSVGILVALAAALIGMLIGSLAGFYGGVLDTALMRVTDALMSLPLLPVLIVFAAVDLGKIPLFEAIVGSENESIIKLVFILCIFSWMTVARLVRGAILSLKEREFVLAARTVGAKNSDIILTHMLPNVLAPLLVAVTLNVGQSILSEAALSFLGLGIQPPTPSWGNMLFNAQELIYEAPFLAIIPGVLILIIVVSFNFVGDGLQDAVDPKAVKR